MTRRRNGGKPDSGLSILPSPRPTPPRRSQRRRRRAQFRRSTTGRFGLPGAFAGFAAAAAAAGLVAGSALAAAAVLPAAATLTVSHYVQDLPSDLPDIVVPARSTIVAADGTPIAQVWTIDRIPVGGEAMSPWLRKAAVATEDARFYSHPGVDAAGLARAAASTLSGQQVQGGSSITQQYVKNMLIAAAVVEGGGQADPADIDAAAGRSAERKLREMKTALAVERTMGKEDILTGYLNISYFGSGAYGAEAAARRYFSTTAANLTLAQSALLAGLLQSPGAYDPLTHPEAALARRGDVLDRMEATGAAPSADITAARSAPLELNPSLPESGCTAAAEDFGFVCAAVLDELADADWLPGGAKSMAAGGSVTITTTVDPGLQHAAVAAARSVVGPEDRVADASAAVEPGTGAIRSLATNRNYGTGEGATQIVLPTTEAFNPGSTFKLFTLLSALEAGINTETVLPGGQTYFSGVYDNPPGGYRNAESADGTNVTIRKATEQSMNVPYVQLMERVGIPAVASMANRLGVTSIGQAGTPDGPGLREGTFTLGARNVSVTAMAGAYAAVAAHGVWCPPHLVASVTPPGGQAVTNPAAGQCRRVLTAAVADTATDVLAGDARTGTGTGGGLPDGRALASKTGTAENHSAAWYIGYTPHLAVAVWMGDPDRPLDGLYDVAGVPVVYGGTLPARVFRDTMWAWEAPRPAAAFPGLNGDYLLGLAAPPGTAVVVPDVAGMPSAQAAATLTAAGWHPSPAPAPDPGHAAPGTAVATSPPAGTVLDGTARDITVLVAP